MPFFFTFLVWHVISAEGSKFAKATNTGSTFHFRNDAINVCICALINQWKKTFGKNHVIIRESVKMKLVKIVKSYYADVYLPGKGKSS